MIPTPNETPQPTLEEAAQRVIDGWSDELLYDFKKKHVDFLRDALVRRKESLTGPVGMTEDGLWHVIQKFRAEHLSGLFGHQMLVDAILAAFPLAPAPTPEIPEDAKEVLERFARTAFANNSPPNLINNNTGTPAYVTIRGDGPTILALARRGALKLDIELADTKPEEARRE